MQDEKKESEDKPIEDSPAPTRFAALKNTLTQAAQATQWLASETLDKTKELIDRTKQGVEELQGKFPEIMNEKMPKDIEDVFRLLVNSHTSLIATGGFIRAELKADANNGVVADPRFIDPLHAMLVAREMWDWIGPNGKYKKKEKDLNAAYALFKTYSPIFSLRIANLETKGVDFDDLVVSGFISENSDTYYEEYFIRDPRRLETKYEEFVKKCASFLPQFVQGNALCKLMCAKAMPDGSIPIQSAILKNQEIIDKFVLFQYASVIETVTHRLHATQKQSELSPSKSEKRNMDKISEHIANRLGAFLIRYCQNMRLPEKEFREMREIANRTSYPIYQLLLRMLDFNKINNGLQFLLTAFHQHMDEFFYGSIQNLQEWPTLLTSFKQDTDIDLKLDSTQFNDIVDESQAKLSVELLLEHAPVEPVNQGLQTLFGNATETTASLGPVLLNKATTFQLREVARCYPNAGQYFVTNVDRFCIPLIETVAEELKFVDRVDDNTQKICLAIGQSKVVLSKLKATHLAKLIAINAEATNSIATYLRDHQKYADLVEMLAESCVTSESVVRLDKFFNAPFITLLYDYVVEHLERISPAALAKILRHGDEIKSGKIFKALENNHPIIFKLLSLKDLDGKIQSKLEEILTNHFKKLKKDKIAVENMSKYLKCRALVLSQPFFDNCSKDVDAFNAAFETVLHQDLESLMLPQREWVLPFVCKLVANASKDKPIKSKNLVPLLDLDPEITQALLRRSVIVEELASKGSLKNNHWPIMLELLFEKDQDLLKSPMLATQLVLRMNNIFLTSHRFAQLFEDKIAGQMLLNNFTHQQRVIIIQNADDKLMQTLLTLDIKLFDILATCLKEITNPLFYQIVLKNDDWRDFILEAPANQTAMTAFIRANSDKEWIEPLARAQSLQNSPVQSRELRFTARVGAYFSESKPAMIEVKGNNHSH